MKIKLEQIAEQLQGRLYGDGSVEIANVGTVTGSGPDEITFVTDSKHRKALKHSKAAAVLTGEHLDGLSISQVVVDNVDKALIELMKQFAPQLEGLPAGVDETAKVGHNVKLGLNTAVGPDVVIHDNVTIGDNTVLECGGKIGENVRIGSNCRLDCNVVIYHNCEIGDNVIIQANTVIGSTGFGYSFIAGEHRLIPHNGTVVIEDDVEIGANSCVDRAKFGETRIGAGTKIDNLVQIAHNVVIGKKCLLAGQTGLAGSVRLGDGVAIGGQTGVGDNITIGSGARVGACSGVLMRDVEPGQVVFGLPAEQKTTAMRKISVMNKLPEIFRQFKDILSRISKLEASKDNKD